MSEASNIHANVNAVAKGPVMHPTSSQNSVLAHTLIVITLIGFSGAGMLAGKIHPYVFVAIGALSVGWLPPAVFLNVVLRIMQENARAWLSPPPGGGLSQVIAENTGAGTMTVNALPATAPTAPAAAPAAPADDQNGDANITARRSILPPPGIAGMMVFASSLAHYAQWHEAAIRDGVRSATSALPYVVTAGVILAACVKVMP